MTEVAELADFLMSTRREDLPADVVAHAGLVLADTLAVTISGSRDDQVTRLAETAVEAGPCVLWRAGFPHTSAAEATLVNAVAATTTELDEGARPTGHPAIHVVPTALAQAQATGASGADCVRAIVLGYEAQARLQRACTLRPGVHCHGNLGNVAAITAHAALAGWSGARLAAGLNAAAAFAATTTYDLCYAGATVRNAAPAVSAQTALLARRLVESGFSAWDGSVVQVFGSVLGDSFTPAELVKGLGESWSISDNYVKFHAACGHTHPVLDSLRSAFDGLDRDVEYPWSIRLPFRPEDVTEVEVSVGTRAAELSATHVTSPLGAKFSIPYAVASFLVHGDSGPLAYEEPVLHDPRVRALAGRVRLVVEEEFDRRWPREHHGRVTVRLADGTTWTGSTANPYGNPENRADRADVESKFLGLVRPVVGEHAARSLWQWATTLGDAPNVLWPTAR